MIIWCWVSVNVKPKAGYRARESEWQIVNVLILLLHICWRVSGEKKKKARKNNLFCLCEIHEERKWLIEIVNVPWKVCQDEFWTSKNCAVKLCHLDIYMCVKLSSDIASNLSKRGGVSAGLEIRTFLLCEL